MQFTIQVDDKAFRKWLATAPRNLRFAASVGLNRTVDEAQREIQASLGSKFTLRRADFVKRTIYRKPGEDFATKDKLIAAVQVNPERDFLAKFEAGGDKTSKSGGPVAIPIDIRRNKNDIVPKSQWVGALLAAKKAFIKNGLVLQRLGTKATGFEIRLAYIFKPSVRIRPVLKFVETARAVAARRLVPNVAGSINRMIAGGWQEGSSS